VNVSIIGLQILILDGVIIIGFNRVHRPKVRFIAYSLIKHIESNTIAFWRCGFGNVR